MNSTIPARHGHLASLARACHALLLAWLLAMLAATGARAQMPMGTGAHNLKMQLIAESDHPRAGEPLTVALFVRPEPGWHGYWLNPGDAGIAARLRWKLPAGATISAPRYPVPTTLLIGGLMNYVFDTPYALLFEVRLPSGLAPGTRLPVRLHSDHLACTQEICVPESADLSLDLTTGDGTLTRRAQFDRWRAAVPAPIGMAATWTAKNGAATIAIPFPATAPITGAYFFSAQGGTLDYAAPQSVERHGDRLTITTKAGQHAAGTLDGVLRIAPGRGLAVHATFGPAVAETGAALGWRGALAALGGAILGGLLLNLMPCVFPILSLKALALARAGEAEGAARREALAYTAGVVLVAVALGGIILALRAGGSAVGWAFQLQNPAMIAVLLVLTAVITLNLAGLFELPAPTVAGQGGAGSAFATGALAAFIATPCSGPFMGAALGAALVLPWGIALAIFAGLGVGLALPYLAIGFVPAVRRRLPKPGKWMATFRRILAVPMALTVLALGYVLMRLAGPTAVLIGTGAVIATAVALALAGWRQRHGKGGVVAALAVVAVVTGGAASVVARVHHAPITVEGNAHAQPFSEARLQELRRQNRPVFVYFTADWCLTCKVNERVAIDTAGVQRAFADHHVVSLVGDWTSGDPVLGRFIESHNRAGVPLYLYYPPGGEPRVLPQVLTPGLLRALGT